MSGVIPRKTIGTIYVRKGHNIPDDKYFHAIDTFAKKLAKLKRKLMVHNPVIGPHTPKAVTAYYPTLLSGKGGKVKVQPGRLRRAIALGFTWGDRYAGTDGKTKFYGIRGLRHAHAGLGRTSNLYVVWGVGPQQFGSHYLPYGGFVSKMKGMSTGGGPRYKWDSTFRLWLAKYMKKLVGDVNRDHRFTSPDKFWWRTGPNIR